MGNVDIIYRSRVSDTERKVESGRSFRSCVLLSPGQREGRGAGEACREIGGVFPIVIFAMWGAQVSERHQEDSVTVQYLLLNPALETYLPVYLMRSHVRSTVGLWMSLLA